MTLSQYQGTYSWQGAIALGSKLLSLAEELPASEESGLSLQLRQLTVEVPAVIAADLLGSGQATLASVLKLITVLELIDHIYPALDTADVRAATDALAERLASGHIAELQAPPAAPAPVFAEIEAADETPLERAQPAVTATVVELAATPLQPFEIATAPASNPLESEETDVHPDSV